MLREVEDQKQQLELQLFQGQNAFVAFQPLAAAQLAAQETNSALQEPLVVAIAAVVSPVVLPVHHGRTSAIQVTHAAIIASVASLQFPGEYASILAALFCVILAIYSPFQSQSGFLSISYHAWNIYLDGYLQKGFVTITSISGRDATFLLLAKDVQSVFDFMLTQYPSFLTLIACFPKEGEVTEEAFNALVV